MKVMTAIIGLGLLCFFMPAQGQCIDQPVMEVIRSNHTLLKNEHDSRSPAAKTPAQKVTHTNTPSSEPVAVDERPMWKLLHQGRLSQLRRLIADTRKKKPGWQPSSALRQSIRDHKTELLLKRQQKQQAWRDTLAMYRKYTTRFDCSHAYRRLYVNEAMIQLGKQDEVVRLYRDTLLHCRDEDRVSALEHAAGRLDDAAMKPLLTVLEQRPLPPALQARQDAITFRHWLAIAQQGGHPEAVKHLRQLLPRLKSLQRADVYESLAWIELKYQHPEQALAHFRAARMIEDRDSSLKGEVIALHAAGQAKAMQDLMEQEQLRLDHMGALPDLLPLLAAVCAEHQDSECQLMALRKIEAFRPLRPEEEEQRAWIQYNKDQFSVAADNFERIYRQQRLEGAAKGLFVSLMRLGQTTRATRLADELGGPFQDIVDRGDAERFYMRKLFHAAQAYNESFDDSLKHLDADYVRAGFMKRRRGGNTLEPVFNQFLQRKLVLEGGTFRDKKHHIYLRYEPTQLDVGQPLVPLGDNFGTNPVIPTPTRFPLQTRQTGYEWNIGYRYEDWRTWYADIGQGFVHGRLQPTFKGHLGVKQEFLAGFINAQLFRQPLRESMLSYAGMNDPFTNNSWGRVTRTGMQLDGYRLTGIPDVGLTWQARAEWMRGIAVQKNRHLLLNIFIPRHFQWFRDTEWSVGPLYQWEAFANDQGHFMWGHGGYFSPQNNNYFGLNTRFISREGGLYNYEFRAFFGLQSYSTKTTPLLPFTPDGRIFAGQRIHERMYQIQGKIVRDLPWWGLQIGGAFAWSDAVYRAPLPVRYNNFRDFLLSVYLTWRAEERLTTMSSDHPLFGIETLY